MSNAIDVGGNGEIVLDEETETVLHKIFGSEPEKADDDEGVLNDQGYGTDDLDDCEDEDDIIELESSMPTVSAGRGRRRFFTGAQRQWVSDDQKFWGCSSSYDSLPPGLYKSMYSDNIGPYVEKQIIDTDDLIILPDTECDQIINDISRFWELKDEFDKRGFIHKRGILLWGDPGSGKTSIVQLLIKRLVDDGGLAIFISHPANAISCLQMIRRIEPDRKLIVIMEDLESMTEYYAETEYLSLLDGENQIGNVVFVATTNYPEKLDKRFMDRPSRFDIVQKVGMPNEDARRFYISNKEPTIKGAELDKWVALSEDMGIAHIKEMIICNKCYGITVEKIVERLHDMRKRKASSDDALSKKTKGSVGF